MKLGGGTPPPAPAPAPAAPPMGDMGAAPAPTDAPPAPADVKPFDDQPFDAGVDADEESDPKKFIQQLSGKLGQSLRKYTEQQGQPDFELEKFTINSVLGATNTSEMPPEDQDDIVKKIKSAGGGEADTPPDKGLGDAEAPEEAPDDMPPAEEPEEDLNESKGLFLDNPKKVDMFSHEAGIEAKGKIKEELSNIKRIFVTKNMIEKTIKESLNQNSMDAPTISPVTKPQTTPITEPVKPSRRNKPFQPSVTPSVTPAPKAMTEVKKNTATAKIYHGSFTEAAAEMRQFAENSGYSISDDEWFTQVSNGPKRPSEGQTNKYHIEILKDGIPSKKMLHAQVFGMRNQYELNVYIN